MMTQRGMSRPQITAGVPFFVHPSAGTISSSGSAGSALWLRHRVCTNRVFRENAAYRWTEWITM